MLALAEAGAPAAASRHLGLDATTILRRLDALEARLALRLFDRLPGGYVPTAGGERLLQAARVAEETVMGLDRGLAGADLRLTGRLRVTTTDTLLASVLPDALAEFRGQYPGIVLDLVPANALFTLARRDADVAIRPASAAPADLIAHRVCDIAFAAYAAPGQTGTPHWVAPDESLAGIGVDEWMRAHVPVTAMAGRAASLVTLAALARAGLGRVALPCYLGDRAPGLVRCAGGVLDIDSALWLLIHPDLAGAPRINAFVEVMMAALTARRALFEGRRPCRAP